MTRTLPGWAFLATGTCAFVALASSAMAGPHDALITKHASTYGVPESLVRRVIHIESKGNPRVVSKGNYGLMQIRLGTAKSMGYGGTADGLLDADTNMTYAVKYLASAYRAAGCSEDRAVAYYQRGFYKKPQSSCGPRPQPAAIQVAAKQSAPAAEQLSAAERISAPFEVLRPKVVQVQTIVRPKTLNLPAQNAQAQTAQAQNVQAQDVQAQNAQAQLGPKPTTDAQSSAPMQSASLQLAAARSAAPVETKSSENKSSDMQLPLSPPLPLPARRPELAAAAPQTVAKAPDVEQVWPPSLTPEQPAVAILPMPKPRPAKAPKALARLDVTGQDVGKEDAVASDVTVTDQSSAERAEAAVSETKLAKLDPQAVPLPQPRPEIEETPEREAKPAHRASHRHGRRARTKQPETPALIALFQKLTTPTQPAQPTRRRR